MNEYKTRIIQTLEGDNVFLLRGIALKILKPLMNELAVFES